MSFRREKVYAPASLTDTELLDALIDYQRTGFPQHSLVVVGAIGGGIAILCDSELIAKGATLRDALRALVEWRKRNPFREGVSR